MRITPAPLGLYVHWPFCKQICPYCDFNVVRDKGQDSTELLGAIIQDIIGWHERLDNVRPLSSISFGGGTPSRLSPNDLQKIISIAERCFGFESGIEISLEANPTDQDTAKFKDYAAFGVNRLSLGVQSLSSRELAFLGRDHTAVQGQNALEMAQAVFETVSADFIYGLPEQTLAEWGNKLDLIFDLQLPHYSFYCLTIEPGTPFYKQQQRNVLHPKSADQMADFFEQTEKSATNSNLNRYEISNFATSPKTQSRHNLLYWQGHDWIGVGPGAHGRVQIHGKRQAIASPRSIAKYQQMVAAHGWSGVDAEILTGPEDLTERLAMGLRLTEGIDLQELHQLTGQSLPDQNLKNAVQAGIIRNQAGRIFATDVLLVDRIALELLK